MADPAARATAAPVILSRGNLLRGEGGVALHGLNVLGKRFAREVQNVALQLAHAPVYMHAFVNEIAHPSAFAALVEANFAVRIPARMQNPAAQITRQSRHGVAVDGADRSSSGSRSRLRAPRSAPRRHRAKDPIVRGLFGGPVLLPRNIRAIRPRRRGRPGFPPAPRCGRLSRYPESESHRNSAGFRWRARCCAPH